MFVPNSIGAVPRIFLVKEQCHFTILLPPLLNTIKIYYKYADVTPEGVGRD